MANSNTGGGVAGGGVGLLGLLFLLFLGLKLAEVGQVAAWSWWWVTAPLWIPFAAFIIFIVIAVFVVMIAKAMGAK